MVKARVLQWRIRDASNLVDNPDYGVSCVQCSVGSESSEFRLVTSLEVTVDQ